MRYRATLTHIATVAEEVDQFELAANQNAPISGEIDGIKFTTVRAARAGKHADVLVVECRDDQDNPFSCVLRSGTEAAGCYLEVAARSPEAAAFEPALYGTVESAAQRSWTVMERLRGVELAGLTRQLEDPAFAERYARNVAALLEQTASAGMILKDCLFSNGHNVMYDDAAGRLRLIEQTTLAPADDYLPSELMTRQLLAEVGSLAGSEPGDTTTARGEFVMRLFQMVLNAGTYPASTLFDRARGLLPTHPGFAQEWDWQIASGVLSAPPAKEVLEGILGRDKDNIAQGHPRLLLVEDPRAEGFSPAFIDAAQRGDRETFLRLIASHEATTLLSADQDSRYAPVARAE